MERKLSFLQEISSITPTVAAGVSQQATAMAGWHSARTAAIAQLNALGKAIMQMKLSIPMNENQKASFNKRRDGAIIQLRAIRANLTENPDTRQRAAALQRYLQTDSVVQDADTERNGFGIKIELRKPLLHALELLIPTLSNE